jgi:hypothetical protein
LSDYLSEQPRDRGTGDTAIGRLLGQVEAREELADQLEAEFDREILDQALRRVQTMVPGFTRGNGSGSKPIRQHVG